VLSRPEILGRLRSTSREIFLAELLDVLNTLARDAYRDSDMSPERARHVLQVHNEMSLVVTSQLIDYLRKSPSPAYPEDVFLDVLFERAEIGGLTSALEFSIDSAARRCRDSE
jgi:hypothetical protein